MRHLACPTLALLLATSCGGKVMLDANHDESGGAGGTSTCPDCPPPEGGDSGGSVQPTRPIPPCARSNKITTFVFGEHGVWDVAVDADWIYWTNWESGTVSRIRNDGTEPQDLAFSQAGPNGIAVDGDRVVWANELDGTIAAMNRAGGPVETIAEGQANPRVVHADDSGVYWTNLYGGTVARLAPGGSEISYVVEGQSAPSGLGTDETYVYFTDVADGVISRVRKTGGEPAAIVTGQSNPTHLAVSGDTVYWTVQTGCAYYAPKAGGKASLLSCPAALGALAADGRGVYWGAEGTILSKPSPAEDELLMVSASFTPRRMKVDEHCVYWTTSDTGAVLGTSRNRNSR